MGGGAKGIEPMIMEIGDAKREPKAQEEAEREHVVGNAAAVCVVDGGVQIGAVVEQTVQDVERFAIGDRDRLAMVGRVAARDVRVKADRWRAALVRVDGSRGFSAPAQGKVLAVGA